MLNEMLPMGNELATRKGSQQVKLAKKICDTPGKARIEGPGEMSELTLYILRDGKNGLFFY
jgi:hypothetical protein